MPIETIEQFESIINTVLPMVKTNTGKFGTYTNIYKYIYTQLNCMLQEAELDNFSIESKQKHSILHALNSLYDGVESLPKLGEILYEIEDFFQMQDIFKISREEKRKFLALVQKP